MKHCESSVLSTKLDFFPKQQEIQGSMPTTNPRISATRQQAFTLLDDLRHMREVVAKMAVTSGDLRRLSNVLRRLLIAEAGDLPKVAGPRLGRALKVSAPDIEYLKANLDKRNLYLASLGASKIFGSRVETLSMSMNWIQPHLGKEERAVLKGQRGEPDQELKLVKLDAFLKQDVIFFAGQWYTRLAVLKHICNIAGGVHSGDLITDEHKNLHRIRQLVSYFMSGGSMGLRMHADAVRVQTSQIDVNHHGVDLLLVQVMATARYITISPDTAELEKLISAEFGILGIND